MRERRYLPYTKNSVLVTLAVVSFVTLLIAICLAVDYANFKRKSETVNAVVTDAYVSHRTRRSRGRRRSSGYSCTVYLEYTVDGETYKYTIHDYDRSSIYISEDDYIGMTVPILYNTDDPSDAREAKQRTTAPFVITGIGAGVLCLILSYRNKYYERMIKNGAVLDAVVVDVEHKTEVRYSRYRSRMFSGVDGFRDEEHFSVIVCEWENPITKQKYVFRSQKVSEFVEPYVGQTIRVYADPQNYEKYYVDVDYLLAQPFMNGKNKHFTYPKISK